MCVARWKALRASPGPRLRAALETLTAAVVSVAAPEVVQRCCDTVTSQGVVALVDRPTLPFPETLRTVLICDGIQDPGGDRWLPRLVLVASFGSRTLRARGRKKGGFESNVFLQRRCARRRRFSRVSSKLTRVSFHPKGAIFVGSWVS